ncbi:aquaporin-7 isoform X5 [Sciurus carolinensis]|uniref:aquaporin-7 isoform X5 n=1 Tax=Sciurus carolinensis TaxID=30640 RepID=UPI001FB226A8|nr:aquaporin-7 isoform X5 [Sciurus carolinensis]
MAQAGGQRRSNARMGSWSVLARIQAILQKEMVREFLAEFMSTYVMMVFGLGSVAHMVLGGKNFGSFLSVNLGFGFGVTMGIHVAGNISGAHMNAAVTFATCALGRMPWKKFPVYVLGQFLGSFMAAVTIYGLFYYVCDRDASAVSLRHHGQGQQSSTARDGGSGGRHPHCHHRSIPRHEYRICYEPIPGPASSLLHFHSRLGQTGVQRWRQLVVGTSGGTTPRCLPRWYHLCHLHWLQHPKEAPEIGELHGV